MAESGETSSPYEGLWHEFGFALDGWQTASIVIPLAIAGMISRLMGLG